MTAQLIKGKVWLCDIQPDDTEEDDPLAYHIAYSRSLKSCHKIPTDNNPTWEKWLNMEVPPTEYMLITHMDRTQTAEMYKHKIASKPTNEVVLWDDIGNQYIKSKNWDKLLHDEVDLLYWLENNFNLIRK